MAAEVRGLYNVADPNNFNFLPLLQSTGLYLVVHSKQRNHNDDLTISFITNRLAATLGLKMFSWPLVKDIQYHRRCLLPLEEKGSLIKFKSERVIVNYKITF